MAKKRSMDELKREVIMTDHVIPINELWEKLKTNLQTGLTNTDAHDRLIRDGPNSLTPPKVTPWYVKLAHCMFSGFAALLWAGLILCFIAYGAEKARSETTVADNLYLGVVLATIVILTSGFQYFQEAKISNIMEKFKTMIPQSCKVKRNGTFITMDAKNLVVGDVVEVNGGDRTPADIRMVECYAMKVKASRKVDFLTAVIKMHWNRKI